MTSADNYPGSGEPLDPEDPLVGELIGERYRVKRVLGTGGTGTVYLAEHVLMQKRVALKVLHATHAVIGSAMERFQREAIALSRIEHPNVVSATDFGKLKNGAYYLALEYVEGQDLSDVLSGTQGLGLERSLTIAQQIASALAAAHSQGIVHRDLKPLNVMLTESWGHEVVKVLDFGLAKLHSKPSDVSVNIAIGKVFGTPHYMAPEQISGEGVDQRADLYALGIILYEMLTGTRPFDSKNLHEVLSMQAAVEPPPLPESLPRGVRDLVRELLAKSPAERPASAELVMQRLSRMLPSASPWRRIPRWLNHRFKLGQWSVPAWGLALPGVAFVVLFVIGASVSRPAPAVSAIDAPTPAPPTAKETPTPPPTSPARPDHWLALLADAEFGKPEALEELLKVPAKDREPEVWLVLLKGHMQQEQPGQAMELLREATQHHPSLANNEEASKLVRVAAGNPEGAKTALAVAAGSMGARGVDVLFSVWADTKRRNPTTALAEQYLQQADVRALASPAAQLALALRELPSGAEQPCEEIRKWVEQAAEHGDARSLRPLTKLKATRGCGKNKREDCFPCLREDALLQEAIQQAGSRPGPKY